MKSRHTNILPHSLDALLAEEDDLGLLAEGTLPSLKPKEAPREDQAVVAFMAVVDFYQQNQREPDRDVAEERSLAIRLEAYRARDDLRVRVQDYDTVGLLCEKAAAPRSVTSLDDIFDDDDLGLLDGVDTSIFSMNHVRPAKEKELPEEIGTSKPCEDF